jgi:VIT1/CCC1 family predicted Fe2+/Mn2+ transporter
MKFSSIVSKYIAQVVYGATDGIVTTFAVIGGVYGAGLSPVIVIILGMSNVLADGFSMAASNYLSKKSENGYAGNDGLSPIRSSLATFLAFVIVGLIPLLPFIYALFVYVDPNVQFGWSIAATAAAFILLGLLRGKVMKKRMLGTAIETLVVGGIAAVIAYGVGVALKGLV